MSNTRVAILDDHQSIIDGYTFRLNQAEGIEVVFSATTGSELQDKLAQHPVDVLLLDVNVPTAPDNPNPYPILPTISRLLQDYSNLSILIISMYTERTLIKALITAGISGYVLKDDRESIQNLGRAVLIVAKGGIYFSRQLKQYLPQHQEEEPILTSRQLEVLYLFAAYPGITTAAAAQKLNIAHSTMRNLLSSTYLRLGVHNRSAAIIRARELGLLSTRTPRINLSDLRLDSDEES